jgi:RNA polymerase sigma-70 factor (ECF subfamily)
LKTRENEFLALIEVHKGILHKISKMYMDTRDDQQDLFQEMIYQIWRSYDSFNHESRFSTWMYRVAVNTALLFFKKEKRNIPFAGEVPDQLPYEEGQSDRHELQLVHFYQAVNKLESIEKALIFYHLENYSHKETAENLGISEVNARVKLSRAKTRLKEIIKTQGYEF